MLHKPICMFICLFTSISNFTRLYKLLESENGTKMPEEKWPSVKSKYLQNKKTIKGLKSHSVDKIRKKFKNDRNFDVFC